MSDYLDAKSARDSQMNAFARFLLKSKTFIIFVLILPSIKLRFAFIFKFSCISLTGTPFSLSLIVLSCF